MMLKLNTDPYFIIFSAPLTSWRSSDSASQNVFLDKLVLWFSSHYQWMVKAHAASHQAGKVCDIRDGGLHRTMIWWPGFWNELLWWMLLCAVSWSVIVACWENRLVGGKEESRLSLSIFIFVLTVLLLSSSLCIFWISSSSVSVCCLSTCLSRKCLPLSFLTAYLPCDFHVFVCLPFSLPAWLSVSHVYQSVVKTFYWLTVTKRGLKC